MSRLSILTLTGLLFTAFPAAASQQATEVVASFDQAVEASPFVASATSVALAPSQQVTEVVASFDSLPEAPALAASATSVALAPSQQVTEVVASFDSLPEAPALAASGALRRPALASARTAETMQASAPARPDTRMAACTCDHR